MLQTGSDQTMLLLARLNIVRTALIFVDDNEDDLKKELDSNDESKAPEVIDDYEIPNNFENFWD